MPSSGDYVKASDFQAIVPQLRIGTVTTGAPGTAASASITGTSPNFVLNLTIPRGANGAAGQSGVLGTQVFTSSTTVTVPAGATKAIISGCGGGGGGAYSRSRRGGSGGNGGTVRSYPINVSAGSSIKITIGSGGAGGTSGVGSNGGSTNFGSLLTLGGGQGGRTEIGNDVGDDGVVGSSPFPSHNILPFGVKATGAYPGNAAGKQGTGYGIGGEGGSGYGYPGARGTNGILIVTWAK